MSIQFKHEQPLKEYDAVSLAEMLRAHFVENYPQAQVEKLNTAIQIGSYLHRNDVRRGARGKNIKPPYFEHPLRVALRMVRTFKVDYPSWIIAAVLHDTVEDHAFDFADFWGVYTVQNNDEEKAREFALEFITEHLGFQEANHIKAVTNPVVPESIEKSNKILAYRLHVEKAVRYSPAALYIKASDLIDNAGSLHHHYEYSDPKVMYFVERYYDLIPFYIERMHVETGLRVYSGAAIERLEEVKAQLDKFKEAQA